MVMMMTVVVVMTVTMQMVMMTAMGGVIMRLSIALLGLVLVFDDARSATADSAHQATSSSMRRKSSPRVI